MLKLNIPLRRLAYTAATALALMSFPVLAQAQGIPTTLGWFQIPNTKLRSVCAAENGFPQVSGNTGCAAITLAWSGGTFDTARNRLIIWGGGHTDYYGNEIYALDLDELTIGRLTNPGTPIANGNCQVTSIAGGTQPNSRHTYNGLAYIDHTDQMFVVAGSLASDCGASATPADIWLFNLTTNTWSSVAPVFNGVRPGDPSFSDQQGYTAVYHAAHRMVYFHDQHFLFRFDPSSNTVTQIGTRKDMGYHTNAVLDPIRNRYLIVGSDNRTTNGITYYDLTNARTAGVGTISVQSIVTTGSHVVEASDYPGLAYDPIQDRIVGWNGGSTIYLLNPGDWTWNTVNYSGGPTALVNGTNGRFRYSSSLNVFTVCNSVDSNCYALRLTGGGGTTPPTVDTTAPSVPTGLVATAVSTSQINLSWNASADNVGVAGYQLFRSGTQIATSTTTSFSETGLSASTSYNYTVAAYDAAGNASAQSASASASTLSNGQIPPSSADADFQARCNAPGVLKCVGFDNTSTDIVQGVNLHAGNFGYRGALDTTTKASGAGSLRFELPGGMASPNIAGSWSPLSNDGLGQNFGQNSTFYVQFRQRFSPEMISNLNTWDSAWKQVIFHRQQTTCASIELTMHTYLYSRSNAFPQMYTDCGARHMYTNLDGQTYSENTPLLLQQGNYLCQYGNINPSSCFFYPANNWVTFYYKITIGTWNQPNSKIEAWVTVDNLPYQKIINVLNMTLDFDSSPSEGYNNLTLTPYMTGLSRSSSASAYTWYDELIVSTQPISAPGSSQPSPAPTVPVAPTSLTIK